jgi:hypothetical protein
MARYTDLSIGMVEQLSTLLADDDSLVIERRLKPRRKRNEFVQGTNYISVFCGSTGHEIIGRRVDSEKWEVVVAIQSAGPDPDAKPGDNPFGSVTSAQADPIDWGDEVFALVERIKGFWRAETDEGADDEGPLRSTPIAGCYFISLEHDPVYVPSHLEELGILSIVLQIMYEVGE